MGWTGVFDFSLERANQFYAWGWRLSVFGAAVTMIGVAALWLGTRVRDRDFEGNVATLHERAAISEKQSEELKKGNLILARDLERERTERVKMEQRFGARHFTPEQRTAVLHAFRDKPMMVHVRCIADGEACLAANNFAIVLREAGLVVPPVVNVGLTVPPSLGIEIYDPDGPQGLFASTMLSNISEARFRPVPFNIGGEIADPAIPTMVVRYRTVQ